MATCWLQLLTSVRGHLPASYGMRTCSAGLLALAFGFGSSANLVATVTNAVPEEAEDPPEVKAGERLFLETRFAQFFFVHCQNNVNAVLPDEVLALSNLNPPSPSLAAPLARQTMSCRSCHLVDDAKDLGGSVLAYSDYLRRSAIPDRGDGRLTTIRNSPTLVDSTSSTSGTLLHFDGEFANAEELVKGTFLGRNFGWLPEEKDQALQHFARVIRDDDGLGSLAREFGQLPYAMLLLGTDPAIPPDLQLPAEYRLDVTRADDRTVLEQCGKLVAAYLSSLQFARDESGRFVGSPYDQFLIINHLPREPLAGETPLAYARRLRAAIELLQPPLLVDDSSRPLKYHAQPFRFSAAALSGMKIFFREAADSSSATGVGNCIACHTPPHFTDFGFHNTGASQEEYDAIHGKGSFVRLAVPALTERNANPDRWFAPSPRYPKANGPFARPPDASNATHADLGLWNTYANPDLPLVQATLQEKLNPDGRLSQDDILAGSLARFKTPTLRDLGQSAPYLHTGQKENLDDVLEFYERMLRLTKRGELRNAPPEFSPMQLDADDMSDLVEFLHTLNEDYD